MIGRSMNDAVNPYAQGLAEQGYDVETFSGNQISKNAGDEWEEFRSHYSPGYIPDNVVVTTQMYQENAAWAQKLASQGYTVVDVDNPTGLGQSQFYNNMETQALFDK